MSSPRVALLALLAFSGQVLGPAGKERLQAPRNLKLVSEDFKLFLTWQPADNNPSEVFYTVKWKNSFVSDWITTHCVNITATTCDITCVNSKPSNRFKVQVEALERTGSTSEAVPTEFIDYDLLVELGPPVLQVRQAEGFLIVNTTFNYPSCMKDFFQVLKYDIEFWEPGSKPKKLSNLGDNVVNISTTAFSGSRYCLRAQANLFHILKQSNFSKSVCEQLHEKEESWRLIVILSLLLLVLPACGVVLYISWYRKMAAKFKMPQALDFSSYKDPKRFLVFDEMKVDVLVCEGERIISGIRRRPAPQINVPSVPPESPAAAEEEDEEEDEDEDDSGSLIPYTEFRFPKKDMSCQGVGVGQNILAPSSDSDSSQSSGGCGFPDVIVLELLISTELVAEESTSELQGSKRTSLSGSSSAEGSLDFPVGCRIQEDMNGDIDFGVQLSTITEGCDLNLLTGTQFVAAADFPEGSWGSLEDLQTPLLKIQGHEDAILLEEQTEEDGGFERASTGCGRLMKEMLGGVESSTMGGNGSLEEGSVPGPKFHGYRSRHIPYISRSGLE